MERRRVSFAVARFSSFQRETLIQTHQSGVASWISDGCTSGSFEYLRLKTRRRENSEKGCSDRPPLRPHATLSAVGRIRRTHCLNSTTFITYTYRFSYPPDVWVRVFFLDDGSYENPPREDLEVELDVRSFPLLTPMLEESLE